MGKHGQAKIFCRIRYKAGQPFFIFRAGTSWATSGVIMVTTEKDKLFAQLSGQAKYEIFPGGRG
jgi:hypothetical protein